MRSLLFALLATTVGLFLTLSPFAAAESAEPALWVNEPEKVAVAVGNMTAVANGLGLSDSKFEETLLARLSDAGLTPHSADQSDDENILFLDLVVERDTFVASLEFWRKAEYLLPDGSSYSDFVVVWEEYTIGSHLGRGDIVADSVAAVLDSFVFDYAVVNAKVLTSQNNSAQEY